MMRITHAPNAPARSMISGTWVTALGLLVLAAILSGCGCCIVGGGPTTRAERLGYAHKEAEVGVGGPGWWLLRRFGIHFVKNEDVAATLALEGIKSMQVTTYRLEDNSEARQREILALYAEPLQREGWEVLTRIQQEGENTVVFAEVEEDKFSGLFIISIEHDEMSVVKVKGDITPEMMGKLSHRLHPLGAEIPTEE